MAIPLMLSISILLSSLSGATVSATTFTLTNSCGYTVWPGLLSSAGSPPLPTTGFELAPGESRSVDAPAAWSGRVWGRTLCGVTDQSSGRFACGTGECGSGTVECAGGGAAPPTTLAEFTLDGAGGSTDFYDVSLVDGSNLPMAVVPQGSADCGATGCLVDLNGPCPADLKVVGADGAGIACRSACGAYGRPQDCCSGDYGTPDTCRPSESSMFFKNACPRAYSYAYDDATSTFTCASGTASYLITFCPSISSLKSSVSSTSTNGPGLPASDQRHGLPRRPGRRVLVPVRLRVVGAAVHVDVTTPPGARGRRVHVALRRAAPAPLAAVLGHAPMRQAPRAAQHRARPSSPPPRVHRPRQAQAHGTPSWAL